MVALAIVSLLLSLAVPRYFGSIDRGKEVVLRENLRQMREAIDKYHGDNDRYPTTLNDLVERKYLRRVPLDPITDDDKTWVIVPPADPRQGGVFDIKSGATGNGANGTAFSTW